MTSRLSTVFNRVPPLRRLRAVIEMGCGVRPDPFASFRPVRHFSESVVRRALGFSATDISRIAQISQSTVSHYAHGRKIGARNVARIEAAIGRLKQIRRQG